ncbi:MAG: DUF349 domain-containing protein [Bacteroidales bacterium]|nr:DUF349 domain-containing protein [Bacteroidales bacterium]
MEELNAMQENVQNEELQPVVEQNIADADSNTNITNEAAEPVVETVVEATPENEVEPEVDYSAMTREELLAALNELMQENVNKIRNRVSAIRNQFTTLNKEVEKQAFEAFLAEGGNKDDYKGVNDPVAEAFYKVVDTYRSRRQKMQEEQEAVKQRNLEAKRQILDELRALNEKDSESLKQTYDEFNAIQEKWKAIGEVPREQMNDLWQNYHFLIEQFFNKIKITRELRDLDLKRNLEQKIQLCERAEELIVETSVMKAFKTLQELRAQWKEIGPVPQEQNEETWQRFNNAANKIDERRKEYYDQRKEELEQNLLAKQALIEKANELTQELPKSTREWNDTTEALDKLLNLWKSIGPVPREQNEEIWNTFKGTIDKHYADKKQHFGQMRDEQTENYNKKVALCLKAEAIAKREDWKNATEELLQLQTEWKQIGATSRKVSDKVWHRFRSACDEFFAKKAEFFKDIRSNESENLEKKLAIIEEMKQFQLGENKDENLTAVKDFQRRWAEIGHVPMKEKDRVMGEYRGMLDGFFEKLKISAREAEENNYRARIRNFNGDAKKFVNNEKQELMDKIEKLRSDLKLWENNLGFLASSKQADLLKAEFEKKMQGARQQIALLESKLRILAESNEKENE